jgi:hypothetical protein
MVAFPWGVGAATGRDPGCASRSGKPGARDAVASLIISLRRLGAPGPYHQCRDDPGRSGEWSLAGARKGFSLPPILL